MRKDIEFTTESYDFEWPQRAFAGPWNDEPSHLVWTDKQTGYECEVVRVPELGHLCGYVVLPPGHTVVSEDQIGDSDQPHGGVTFFRKVDGSWKVGFDCAHYGDLVPGYGREVIDTAGSSYKGISYVVEHTVRLAQAMKRLQARG